MYNKIVTRENTNKQTTLLPCCLIKRVFYLKVTYAYSGIIFIEKKMIFAPDKIAKWILFS